MILKNLKIIFRDGSNAVDSRQPPLKITYFYNRWHSSGFKTVSKDHF
jgi:hypothetical protein